MASRDEDRRAFLRGACACGATLAAGGLSLPPRLAHAGLPGHPARWYKKLPLKRVECQLCPKKCRVDHTERGFCGVRENHGGDYRTLVYGRLVAMNLDPIEKKPLFHVQPGARTFSIATVGCNMDCRACQNWQISQARPEQVRSRHVPPARLVELAKGAGSQIISYTYTEPVVFLEYVIDSARLARRRGLKTCIISGGNVEVKPLKEACQVVDAIKIDLKSFNEKTYYVNNRGHLKHILRTLETVRKLGKWLEIVYLVIPTINDSAAEVKKMVRWVKRTLGRDVPVHFTRFHPDYRLKHLPPTPYSTLKRCHDIARAEGLHYPYVGNIAGRGGEDTRCPKCSLAVIERRGYTITQNRLKAGCCPKCGTKIPGIWR
jgi:pyruvate formate lyase activating enzyme